ncbi:MAG TPA: hypothetical protein VNL71_25455 [Chloroflexota bacterium]|nr:hypothetical protein [Chloroflexota bacterium]
MAIYHGTVENNRVVLQENARIPDGTPVEVHVGQEASVVPGDKQLLRERGLLRQGVDQARETRVPVVGRRPITVQGQALSRQIIDERR